MGQQFDQHLLDILVCPLTKTSLVYDEENQELVSRAAGLAYPIRNQIPVMLPEEARIIDSEKAEPYRTFLLSTKNNK